MHPYTSELYQLLKERNNADYNEMVEYFESMVERSGIDKYTKYPVEQIALALEALTISYRTTDKHRKAEKCGCYQCKRVYHSSMVEYGMGLPTCPFCIIDSVIPESEGFPVTEEILAKIREILF